MLYMDFTLRALASAESRTQHQLATLQQVARGVVCCRFGRRAAAATGVSIGEKSCGLAMISAQYPQAGCHSVVLAAHQRTGRDGGEASQPAARNRHSRCFDLAPQAMVVSAMVDPANRCLCGGGQLVAAASTLDQRCCRGACAAVVDAVSGACSRGLGRGAGSSQSGVGLKALPAPIGLGTEPGALAPGTSLGSKSKAARVRPQLHQEAS